MAMSARTSRRGGGRERGGRHAQLRTEAPEPPVVRAEIVAPLADAVGLVHDEPHRANAPEQLPEAAGPQALGGDVDQVEPSRRQLRLDGRRRRVAADRAHEGPGGRPPRPRHRRGARCIRASRRTSAPRSSASWQRGGSSLLYVAPERLGQPAASGTLLRRSRPAAARGGRGPLHQPVGARFPSRLPAARRLPRGAGRAGRRLHRHRHARRPGRHRGPARARGPARSHHRLRAPQSHAGRRDLPRARRQGGGAGAPRGGGGNAGHRLRRHPQDGRALGRHPRAARGSAPAATTPGCPTRSARGCRRISSPAASTSSRPPTPSAWAWTRRTSASSRTPSCPAASRRTIRRRAARAGRRAVALHAAVLAGRRAHPGVLSRRRQPDHGDPARGLAPPRRRPRRRRRSSTGWATTPPAR